MATMTIGRTFQISWVLLAALGVRSALGQSTEPPAPVEATAAADYVIGPGDTLNVFVWRNPELTVSVPVRPDGKISTPLVEDMVAVGKTPAVLARDIEAVLAEYVKQPQVNVIVQVSANAYNQVRVVGQVAKPSAVPYREGMTVLDAILAVGGLTPFAAGNRGKLLRGGDDAQEIKLRLSDLLEDGDLGYNLPLKPGDVIIVPQSRF